MRTALHAQWVLGFDGGDHVLHRDADVVYEEDRIIHAGPGWSGHADRRIDLGAALISPGFIDLDALADIDHALLDSWAGPELRAGHQWSEAYFTGGRRDVFSAGERRFIRRYALTQLLLHGITTAMPIASEVHSSWAENYEDALGIADAASGLGIRTYAGPSYRSGVNVVRSDGRPDVLWDEERGAEGLAGARRFLDHAAGSADPLVRGALLPCRIETMSLELLRETARLARAYDVPVRLHCMQGKAELGFLREWYGATPLEVLESTGLLECRLFVPHAVFGVGEGTGSPPTDGELKRLADAGVTVVHCPLTSLRYGMALRSFDRYRDAGINIALGTDSFPPDLIRGMDAGNSIAKVVDGRLDAGGAADYFRSATLNAARALGRDDLGRLAPGAQADLVVLNLGDFRQGVVDDPLRTLMMAGSARDVTTTVVAGRTVVAEGTVPGLDLVSMRGRAQELFERMRAAYSERDVRRRPAEVLFPPAFDGRRPAAADMRS
ncbi:chlorohydrolase family protein [Streptomyces sp. bgisy031]|uniref:chlorohydrolase family protein n=1 Tax=Streptomyces sp. bgisy031 TaxID=3413772 RepID=UPI003D74E862